MVQRSHGRVLRSIPRHLWARAVCLVRGHDWSPWQIDDYDGPGEDLGGGAFMPYLSRESRPDEFGIRTCRRRCGTMEVRADDDVRIGV